MNRDALRQVRDQIGMFAIAPPIATVAPHLERSVAPPRLTPAVKRALALLVFLAGAALGAMLPAGCAGSRAAKPDACDCVLVDAGQVFGEPGVCVEPVTGKPGLCR